MTAPTVHALALAVFDVDHTLVRGSSGGAFIGYLWRNDVLLPSQKRMVARELLAYRLRRRTGRDLVELGARLFHGLPEPELREHARRCVAEDVHKVVYREALEAIQRSHAQGLTVILASGSTELIIEPLAELVGASLGIGSRAAIRGGRLTDEVEQPVPYKEGKVVRIERAFQGREIDWAGSTAYTDRAIDVPLLERVGRGVAVNPRGSLGPMALERGWRVERWSRVTGVAHPSAARDLGSSR